MVRCWFAEVLSEEIQRALNTVDIWCNRKGKPPKDKSYCFHKKMAESETTNPHKSKYSVSYKGEVFRGRFSLEINMKFRYTIHQKGKYGSA